MFTRSLRIATAVLFILVTALNASECDPKATTEVRTNIELLCPELCTEARDVFQIEQTVGSGQEPDFSPQGEPIAISKLLINEVVSPAACMEVSGSVGSGVSANVTVVATIFVNGERWTQFTISRQLTGQRARNIQMPIRLLRFAIRSGQRGQPPSPGRNVVRAVFQVTNGAICNTCAVRLTLGKLTFTALAPYMLVHGRVSSPSWYSGDFENAFRARGVGYKAVGVASGEKPDPVTNPVLDNISLPGSGRALRTHAEIMAREFGVKRVHVVAHSKGGLWSRAMIDSSNSGNPEVGVYSITSITSPHRGSVLADIAVASLELSLFGARREGLLLTKLAGSQDFDKSLQPATVENHNRFYSLPQILEVGDRSNRVVYASYQADANLNGDTLQPSGIANITSDEACTIPSDAFCFPVPLLPFTISERLPPLFRLITVGAQLSFLLQAIESAFVDSGSPLPTVVFVPRDPPREFNDFAVAASSSSFPPFANIETLKAHHNAVSSSQTAHKILDLIDLDLQKALER